MWRRRIGSCRRCEKGEPLRCDLLEPKDHTTQPPARYTEATLTRTLEEKGIGRPSTYATIIETIQARDYVFKKGNALVPSWTAFSVVRLLEDHLPSLVDYEFTAQMEDLLDAISRREAEHVHYLHDFYFGDGSPGLKRRLEHKEKEIDPRVTSRFPVGTARGWRTGRVARGQIRSVSGARSAQGESARRNGAG